MYTFLRFPYNSVDLTFIIDNILLWYYKIRLSNTIKSSLTGLNDRALTQHRAFYQHKARHHTST